MAVFSVNNVERRVTPGFGGKYEVGRDGSVWRNGTQLSAHRGYINLSVGGIVHTVKVCYLVARAWVPNGEGRAWVRHKNGDPTDNRAENLEWSDHKEELRGRRPVNDTVTVWDKETGNLVGSFRSLKEACAAVGVSADHARKVIRGKCRSAKGYVFKA